VRHSISLPLQPLSPLFITSSPPPPLEQPDTVKEDDNKEENKDKKDKGDKEGEDKDKMSLLLVPISFISH
jgi:hypothetical protein